MVQAQPSVAVDLDTRVLRSVVEVVLEVVGLSSITDNEPAENDISIDRLNQAIVKTSNVGSSARVTVGDSKISVGEHPI